VVVCLYVKVAAKWLHPLALSSYLGSYIIKHVTLSKCAESILVVFSSLCSSKNVFLKKSFFCSNLELNSNPLNPYFRNIVLYCFAKLLLNEGTRYNYFLLSRVPGLYAS
jgi:hypothetical protein